MRSARSKFGNVRVTLDGYTFDSKAEAARYGELKLLVRAGAISGLHVHPRYELIAAGPVISIKGRLQMPVVGVYEADFSYEDKTHGEMIEDVKGLDTPLSAWKRKHMKAQYGIDVRIVKMRRG